MTKFENYLIEKGYKRFYFDSKGNKIEDYKKQDYSSYGPVCYNYEKNNNKIVFGLHEQGLPPTLIYPTFWNKENIVNTDKYLNNQLTPQQNQKYIMNLTNEDLLSRIENNNICFNVFK